MIYKPQDDIYNNLVNALLVYSCFNNNVLKYYYAEPLRPTNNTRTSIDTNLMKLRKKIKS